MLNNTQVQIACILKPSEGAYQPDKEGAIIRETPLYFVVKIEGQMSSEYFRKSDGTARSTYARRFPDYRLDLTSIPANAVVKTYSNF